MRFADYVPDAELEALWRLAGVAAFPTRAEGFGMPVLEALSRGVPVACSDLPVLREVSGGLAARSRPTIPQGAADAIHAAALRDGGSADGAGVGGALHVAGGRRRAPGRPTRSARRAEPRLPRARARRAAWRSTPAS